MQLVVECQSTPDIKADMSALEDILDTKLSSNTFIEDLKTNKSHQGNKENIFEDNCAVVNGKASIPDTIEASANTNCIVPHDELENSDLDEKLTENDTEVSKGNHTNDLLLESDQAQEIEQKNDKDSAETHKCNSDGIILLNKNPEIKVSSEFSIGPKVSAEEDIKISQNAPDPVERIDDKDECQQQENPEKVHKGSNIELNNSVSDHIQSINEYSEIAVPIKKDEVLTMEVVDHDSTNIVINSADTVVIVQDDVKDKSESTAQNTTDSCDGIDNKEDNSKKTPDKVCSDSDNENTIEKREKMEEEENITLEVIDVDKDEKNAIDTVDLQNELCKETQSSNAVFCSETEIQPVEIPIVSQNANSFSSPNQAMEVDTSPALKPPETSISNVHIVDLDEVTDSTTNSQTADKSEALAEIQKEPVKKVCRLSNTLDILSDEEDELANTKNTPEVVINEKPVEKHCINIEDDDDIMVIEDTKEPNREMLTNKSDTTADGTKEITVEVTVENGEQKSNFMESIELSCNKVTKGDDSEHSKPDETLKVKSPEKLFKGPDETKLEKITDKPLVPTDFLKTSKKTLASMTREELEEFCILKIVESVVDRINLADTQSNLKTLAQSLDDYEKKTKMLAKQNRDLQVVLKSIQEEQKKTFSNSKPITPLKITRSVGMQVLMTDKSSLMLRKKVPQAPSAVPPLSIIKTRNQNNQSPQRSQASSKAPTNNENIPVPRLIPASNNTAKNNPKPTSPPSSSKASVSPMNGLRSNTAQKIPEKRTLSKDTSVTVDLTDDEPPNKVVARNPQPPVRLVSPQTLMGPQRSHFGQGIANSHRKVFIPISGPGPNGQARSTQAVLIKPHPPGMQRPRTAAPNIGRAQNQIKTNKPNQVHRHPAPMPEIMKQYHPPNWKALPPAPDLKLSKVENGIVISWKINGYQEDSYEEIASYQLYAYQETSAPPSTALWKKIGDVKALPLPMACTLTQFTAGYSYYFAVRAVDVKSRLGPFSEPGSILLPNKI
ncbi:probable serine/threonine-protein kinase kinX [Bombyx mori]|uniref:Activating transcription factor 7-interacting protein Fn3 domain-containing protein n=1 Tax=Bombyx mori TaxID=7091 RepID=A0A8R2ARI6_BOMMO|nr:probable serine/threonine-protein kinase kinX [Bombyx mori]XP_012550437.2 probable serine/threonine-protein kinase kinX [Bombyx mori]